MVSESLWIANLRRPVHDTLGGLVAIKFWSAGLFNSGDVPFWMGSVRFGFSWAVLHFIGGTITPITLLLGSIFNYNGLVFAADSTICLACGASGAYLLARQYLQFPATAAATALAFVASGSVWRAGIAGDWQAGYMGVPWALLGVTWAAKATTPRERCRAIAILASSYVWIVTSGYPQTWLTLPLFAIPFMAILASTSRHRLMATVATCASAFALALLAISPLIAETLATPLFGSQVRPSFNPNEGALPLAGIFGRLVANPTYTPGATDIQPKGIPMYIGLVGATVLPWRLASSLFSRLPRLRTTATIVAVASLSLASLPTVTGATTLDASQAILATAGLLLLLLALSPLPPLPWRRDELALLALVAFVWTCATENPVGGLIRQWLPPFSWSRWSFGYLGIAVIPELLLAWVTIERIAFPAGSIPTRSHWPGRLPAAMTLIVLATLATCLLWLPGADPTITSIPGEPRIGLLSLIWSAVAIAILAGFASLIRIARRAAYPFLVASSSALLAATLVAGTILASNEPLVHAYLPLPGPGTLTADATHATIVTLAIALVAPIQPARTALTALTAIAAIDVIAAKPRYLADVDMVLGGQPFHDLGSAPRFDFTGTSRDVDVTPFQFGRPGPSAWANLVPQSAALERAFGTPPLFDQFVHFPSEWTNPTPGAATFTPESLGRPASQDLATPVGPAASPVCPASATPANPQPSAMVTRLLSSYVQVTYDTACTRLLAYTDTWAQGWTATIDGTPTPVLHLNGAIRGVIAPAGPHILEWNYRPAFWNVTKWVSLGALATTLACLLWGLWPVQMNPPPPAP